MVDREKVIKGLEHCVEKLDTVVNKAHGFNCVTCPYFRKCDRSGYLIGLPLMRDAIALLKAQEPVEPEVDVDEWKCGKCGHPLEHQEMLGSNILFHEQYAYCPNCGKKVKWDA